MANKFIKKQLDFIVTNANITDIYEIDKIRYVLEVFFNEAIKLFTMLIIALILDKLSAFAIMLTLLLLIRPHVGGSHSNSLVQCLIKSNVVFLCIYIISDLVNPINNILHLIIIIVSIISVLKFNPVNPLRKKINGQYKCIKFKYIVTVTLIIWFLISYFVLPKNLINYGILMISYILVDYLKEVYKHEKTKQS